MLHLTPESLRVVFSYKKDIPIADRHWTQRVVGGHHEVRRAWLEWATESYRMCSDGWLTGDRHHAEGPLAAKFWLVCNEIVRGAGREVGIDKARFVFDKLLQFEAEVSHQVSLVTHTYSYPPHTCYRQVLVALFLTLPSLATKCLRQRKVEGLSLRGK